MASRRLTSSIMVNRFSELRRFSSLNVREKDQIAGPRLHGMIGGEGPLSYAQNSSYQRKLAGLSQDIIEEQISTKLDVKQLLSTCKTGFHIADFGCSTGNNSFLAMQFITQSVNKNFDAEGHLHSATAPEFVVYFNDLPTNDFNTLFTSLPPDRQYRAVGLPGDYKGRLLPKLSLHFAYSCCAVQWLNEIPNEVLDPRSPAWNKGAVFCPGDNKEAYKAYSNQFAKEMDMFLEARAEELVPGGMMALLFPAVPSSLDQTASYCIRAYMNVLNSCIVDMANKGRISEALIDSFNFPWHLTTPEEVKDIILKSPSFSIETFEIQNNPTFCSAGALRAVLEKLLIDHFGSELDTNELFCQYATKLEASPMVLNPGNDESVMILAVLKRNSD